VHAVTPKKRNRRPSLETLIREAERAGKAVSSITTPDGTTVRFGEPGGAASSTVTELEAWKAKKHARQT
jgi:hypothetical protein